MLRSTRAESALPPISELAEGLDLDSDEVELFGRHKAKIDLGVLERLATGPDGKLIAVTAITPTKAGEGKTTTAISSDRRARPHRRKRARLSPRALCRADPGRKGRGHRGGARASRSTRRHQSPLHGRPPRDCSREQPARVRDRRASRPRQRARDRPGHNHLASMPRHRGPRPSPDRPRARRRRTVPA